MIKLDSRPFLEFMHLFMHAYSRHCQYRQFQPFVLSFIGGGGMQDANPFASFCGRKRKKNNSQSAKEKNKK
jgi:hypothetical protein